ncbi:DNA repair protein complementing XP-A cells homolog [Neocloeon triangulifer]|uniref:DNA repair protein complementing XP-A cells homolog n=1 Tax=Neocloeon triangulifer TaxID=2078957 RepID=UPI00286EC784|nr:DNA repair protein complementing XP-A cells homolog [Neocloeon triangulifer]XP_059479751.1 DNA repair protein complementing XP-A cells homolog [Neocloeon triangulifer]
MSSTKSNNSGEGSSTSCESSGFLTALQKERIEINRLRALKLKELREKTKPYTNKKWSSFGGDDKAAFFDKDKNVMRVQGTKMIDTKGGFFIKETDGETEKEIKITEDPQPIVNDLDRPECLECSESFDDSFLLNNFDYSVCDKCKNQDEQHALITKTDAKNTYLLKDCDLDKREPPLKFLLRKNPHDVRWGEMKLYLQLQVEERALEVWGNLEEIELERERRDEKREKSKAKKYSKHMKGLRMQVRSSLYDKTKANHEHEFGPETDLGDDNYSHTCTTCGYEETFEKM